MWEQELVHEMRSQYEYNKRNNPRYSRRAFAKKMGLSPSTLSELFSESCSWRLTSTRAAHIVTKLDLPPAKKNRFFTVLGVQPSIKRRSLQGDEYVILSHWAYYPVLMCFDLPVAARTPEAIMARLGITQERLTTVLNKLVEKGMLVRDSRGALTRNPGSFETTDNIPSEIIRNYHAGNLLLAKRALETIPAEKRDFTSLTIAGSQKNLEKIRGEIRAMHQRIEALLVDDQECTDVFTFAIQFFPVDFSAEKEVPHA